MDEKQFTSAFCRATRTLVVAALAACAACTSVTPTQRSTADTAALETRARAAVEAGNLGAASDLYTQLAAASSGPRRIDFLLQAARLAVDLGDFGLARRRVGEARGGASLVQQQAITVLLARLDLAEGRPQAALDALATLPRSLPEPEQSDAAAVRGRALFGIGRPVDAVRVLVEREVWLGDAPSILANQRMIWDGFSVATPAPLPPTGDTIVDGWLALAPLTRSSGADLRRSLLTWRQTFTTHPAAAGLLAELLAAQRSAAFPAQIAVLLPLSSPDRAYALAIRDGFMTAHLRSGSNIGTNVRVYDTTRLGAADAYLQAQLDGAEFIVGPLLRPEVNDVIGQAGFVPTLALNFASSDTAFLRNFYQFALAPQDEARVIAAAAIAAGAKTAVAFVPSNQRGYEIRDSFVAAFQEAGGELLNWYGYEPALQDFSQPAAALLNVTRSRDRHRRLAANLGVALQFPEPRHREDIDMIFAVVEDDRAGRLIASQLRFFGAGDIAVYANANLYDPANTGRDNDLNGFIFADAPALLVPNDDARMLRAELEAFWPQRAGLLKYYGMGFDAYGLLASLYVDNGGVWSMRGLSGDLSLDGQGRVRRVLPLAQFRNGRPVPLDTASPAPVDSNGLIGQR